MKLTIVIPALNEEESIRSVIERTLDARATIIDGSPVEEVEIVVVSDGSTDRTVEFASEYGDRIRLVVFERNQGYGAAILEGWRQSGGELLSFLDADGTCDPEFLARLCVAVTEEDADIALGCRLNSRSEMPMVRRLGNRLFALALSALSFRWIRDTASGMRVVRRSALPRLMPLPSGLHFTPAMSARAVMRPDVRIVEVDMPYRERSGRSKLHVLRDGIRFARVILGMAVLHRPSRPLGLAALCLFAVAFALMIGPTHHWLVHHRVEEWMIYRFVVSELLGGVSVLLWSSGYLARKAADLATAPHPALAKYRGLGGEIFRRPLFWFLPGLAAAGGTLLVTRALVEFLRTGKVYEHWSRFLAMSFCYWVCAILVVTWLIDRTMNRLADYLEYRLAAGAGSES